ncbi:MAG: hypothetical protein ACU0CA_06990 [Paracoccaceae bacterium]
MNVSNTLVQTAFRVMKTGVIPDGTQDYLYLQKFPQAKHAELTPVSGLRIALPISTALPELMRLMTLSAAAGGTFTRFIYALATRF